MTYLVASDLPDAPADKRFRALLARPGILQLPGAHNGQAALQAKAAGFEGLYLSGAAMTATSPGRVPPTASTAWPRRRSRNATGTATSAVSPQTHSAEVNPPVRAAPVV